LGKIFFVLIAAIFGLLAGTLIGDCITVGVMISNGEIAGAVMSDIPNIILYTLYMEPEYLSGFLSTVGIGFLFVLLGMIGIFRQIARDNKAKKHNATY